MTQIQEYSKTEAALAELACRYKGVVYDVTTVDGLDQAKKARAELRIYRISLEKMRVDIKAPALERCRLIDTEAKRITAELESLENPIDDQIKSEEKKKEEEKLRQLREAQAKHEAEQAAIRKVEEDKLAADRAEIEKARAELAKAEEARLEAERQSRLKIETEQRAARLKIEEEERAAKVARQAEEDRLRSERIVLEEAQRKEREAAEAKARSEREAEEAKQREIQRKKNELLDAAQMLATFMQRFGHLPQFAKIVSAIEDVLKKEAA